VKGDHFRKILELGNWREVEVAKTVEGPIDEKWLIW
jgi:hypothetical protein